MQLSARSSLQIVRPCPGRRANVVCRVSPSEPRGDKFVKRPWGLDLPPISSHSAAYWLVPNVTFGLASCAAHAAGLSPSLQFYGPVIIGVLCYWAIARAEPYFWPPAVEQRVYPSRTLEVEVQEQDKSGNFKTISTFETPNYREILERTGNNRTQLKSLVMQCSEVLRGRSPDEVKVFVVGPQGRLATYPEVHGRYHQPSKLVGLLKTISKVVVRVEVSN